MARRRLTRDEKARVQKFALEREQAANPGAIINVLVEDEIDDDGKVHWCTLIEREAVIPNP